MKMSPEELRKYIEEVARERLTQRPITQEEFTEQCKRKQQQKFSFGKREEYDWLEKEITSEE